MIQWITLNYSLYTIRLNSNLEVCKYKKSIQIHDRDYKNLASSCLGIPYRNRKKNLAGATAFREAERFVRYKQVV